MTKKIHRTGWKIRTVILQDSVTNIKFEKSLLDIKLKRLKHYSDDRDTPVFYEQRRSRSEYAGYAV